MAGKAALTIDVTADTSGAVKNLDKVSDAVKGYGDAADTATRQSRDISGGIEATGGVAATATTGLRDLGGAMSEMGGTMGTVGDAMQTGAIAFEALDGAATLYAASQGIASGAVTVFNGLLNVLKVTILTNPIFLIAAILIAIGAAFVIAYMKCETFRNIVNAAFEKIWGAIQGVYNWVRDNWPLLLAILTGPFGLAVLAIVRNWDSIEDAIRGVYNWINNQWEKVKGFLTKPIEGAWDVISGILDKIKTGINWILDKIPTIHFPSPPSWMPVIGGNAATTAVGYTAPHVPRAGGLAMTRATGPAVINVNVTHTGLGASSPEIQRAVVNALRGYESRNGPIPVRTA